MTAVRVDVALDPELRQPVLDALREQPDVAAVTATPDGFELELAGYAPDAARGRAAEALRTVATATGTDPAVLTIAPDGAPHPGGPQA